MLSQPRLSVQEFLRLPRSEDQVHELRNGVLVQSKRPNKRQDSRIFRAKRVLEPFARPLGILMPHFPFCPLPDFEFRFIDLAFLSQKRWDSIPPDEYLTGSPDLAILLASPNESQAERAEKRGLCLAAGCIEFWIVHTEQQQVETASASATQTYSRGSTLPLISFAGQSLSVAALFAPQQQPDKKA
mgnify:CR=1 FL=1